MTFLTFRFPEAKLPNPTAVRTGGVRASQEVALIFRILLAGSYSAKVMVTKSSRSTPILTGGIPGLVAVVSAVRVRTAGRIVELVMGILAKKFPESGIRGHDRGGDFPRGIRDGQDGCGRRIGKNIHRSVADGRSAISGPGAGDGGNRDYLLGAGSPLGGGDRDYSPDER